MKLIVDFENGMQLSLKPENVELIDNGGQNTVAITRTDNAIIPLIFFKGLLASPEELKAREEKKKAAAAAAEKLSAPAAPAAATTPAAPAAPAAATTPAETPDSATAPQ
jgi:hypothetical protein